MTVEDAINKIDRYFASSNKEPRIVDVPNSDIANKIFEQYDLGYNHIINVSDYSDNDSLPRFEEILNALNNCDKPVFLKGLSTMLKLQGKEELLRVLTLLANFVPKTKLVIITYGCSQYLNFKDRRINDRGQLLIINGEEDAPCRVNFITHDLADSFDSKILGIGHLPQVVEEGVCTDINVITTHSQEDFPTSLIELRNIDSPYQVIVNIDIRFATMKESMGTTEQWQYLLTLLRKRKWEEIVNYKFGGSLNLSFWIDKYQQASEWDKWLYFMAIKTFGIQNNEYLSTILVPLNHMNQIPEALYNGILDYNIKDWKLFEMMYQQRKNVLRNFNHYLTETSNFCKKVLVKGKEAIYYLTDISRPEKELVFNLIEKYQEEYTRKGLLDILKTVNPSLYSYLQPYYFDSELLDSYVSEYKWCKVENKISPKHRQMMEEQSIKRDYNNLPPRASLIHDLNYKKALAFFVDALGTEHLSYIQSRCAELKLALTIKTGRCELPSLTSFNKEFVDTLEKKGVNIINIKDLDEIKHEGTKGYDYTRTKLPIHLIAELEAIDRLLESVMIMLGKDYQRVFLISDHGASRLAVLNENEQQHEMQEKGQHSGRCCPCSEIDISINEATLENDFWCLANYDRFKGGRRASVEVHGGASIEEVVIPIIELTKIENKIECGITEEYSTIYVSFKKKAIIKLYVSETCDHLRIKVNNKFYSAQPTECDYYYLFEMPEIKRAGNYFLDAYDGDNILARNLMFTVKKEGASERILF